jgi:hypothetical protein
MRKLKPAFLTILLVVALLMVAAPPVQAGTGSAAAMTWSSKWELNGNDWKVIFLIPSVSRGYVVQSSDYKANLAVSNSTFVRQWYGGGWDKVTMTTGFRARLYAGYEYFPHSDAKLKTFACSMRIYYWW